MPTLISLAGGQQEAVIVAEPAEEVRKLIRQTRTEGLVRLTGSEQGDPIWINPAYVILVRHAS